ncbi:MAG: tryptophan 7-halogenase [Planctomycetaceae bacterium]
MSGSSDYQLQTIAGRLPGCIVIVGNTESAWMTAACLQRQLQVLHCRITVVGNGTPQAEFPGEESLPALKALIGNLGFDEHEMMRHCGATYRLATQYSDWVQLERDFWLPVTVPAARSPIQSLFEVWFRERKAGRLLRPFHSYALHWGAAIAGKAPCGFSRPSPISESGTYSFHLDGTQFANWLRQIAIASGVQEIQGEIDKIQPNGRGGIAQLRLASGLAVTGDFFIDCTGPAADLITATAKSSWQSWSSHSLCDRLVSVNLATARQVPSFTRITGLESGWSWQSHLSTQKHCGYAYSSQHSSDERAWEKLQESVQPSDTLTEANPILAELTLGAWSEFWRENVLAIGSSACRVDPLSGGGRFLAQLGVELFLDLFPQRDGSPAHRGYYNERMLLAATEFRDFAHLHYLLSRRNDAPFWTESAQLSPAAELRTRIDLFDAAGTVGMLPPESPGSDAWVSLMAASGKLPASPSLRAQAVDPAESQQKLRLILKRNEDALRDLPLHEELLDWIHVIPAGVQEST